MEELRRGFVTDIPQCVSLVSKEWWRTKGRELLVGLQVLTNYRIGSKVSSGWVYLRRKTFGLTSPLLSSSSQDCERPSMYPTTFLVHHLESTRKSSTSEAPTSLPRVGNPPPVRPTHPLPEESSTTRTTPPTRTPAQDQRPEGRPSPHPPCTWDGVETRTLVTVSSGPRGGVVEVVEGPPSSRPSLGRPS